MRFFQALAMSSAVRRPLSKYQEPIDRAYVQALLRLGQRKHPFESEKQELLIDQDDFDAEDWEIVEPMK